MAALPFSSLGGGEVGLMRRCSLSPKSSSQRF